MNIELNYESIKDKSAVLNKDSNVYYQWCCLNDRHNLTELSSIGFAPIKDEKISCPYAEKQKDGTWIRKEYGEGKQLWGCPMDIYKRLRQLKKQESQRNNKPMVKNNKQGVGMEFKTEFGTGREGMAQELAQK